MFSLLLIYGNRLNLASKAYHNNTFTLDWPNGISLEGPHPNCCDKHVSPRP